ncbi:hypothetical protein [Desulfoplanes sp.]
MLRSTGARKKITLDLIRDLLVLAFPLFLERCMNPKSPSSAGMTVVNGNSSSWVTNSFLD